MLIYEYPLKEKPNNNELVLALGFFDGVHVAHRDLLCKARDIARERGLGFGVFTFKSDGAIKKDVGRLYNDLEKAEMFESLGADCAVFADFGGNFCKTSPALDGGHFSGTGVVVLLIEFANRAFGVDHPEILNALAAVGTYGKLQVIVHPDSAAAVGGKGFEFIDMGFKSLCQNVDILRI